MYTLLPHRKGGISPLALAEAAKLQISDPVHLE
jgi:hypothetical protein